MNEPKATLRLGPFEVDPSTNAIIGPEGRTLLEPKVMAVLERLAGRPGEVLTREELIDAVWSREYGGDESLTRAVSLLRKALGAHRGGGQWIETIPKRGYRLIPLPPPPPPADPPPDTAPEPPSASGRARRRPVALLLLALVLAATALALFHRPGPGPADSRAEAPPVLAVLPFDYQGSDTVDAHLADGLADEVLSALARSPHLSLIAGTSSFRFREERKNLELLRRELSITHLVDGTVRRSPTGLRVGVHLVDAATGLVLWSDVFERDDEGFYSIPPAVSAGILTALGGELHDASVAREPDSQAYQAYLQARALIRSGTEPNLAQAITLLERAVERDPGFAGAWGQLAMARLNVLLTFDSAEVADPPQRRQAIRSAARRALELNPDSVDGRLALTTIDYRERRTSLAEAERGYRALADLAPRNPDVNVRLGMMLLVAGRLEDAARRFEAAYDLDRYSGLTAAMYANSFFMLGRWDEGHAVLREQQRASAFPIFMLQQFIVFLLEGRFEEARDWLARMRAQPAADRWAQEPELRARALAASDALITDIERGGRISEATVSELLAVTEAGFFIPAMTIQLLGAGGRDDEVYAIIEEQFEQGDRIMPVASFDPAIASLRSQPRMLRLYAASGQLAYWLETGNWPDFCLDPELPYDCRAVGEELARLGRVRSD